ncbi:MAG: DNA polymerase I [Smithella sp. PtaU1.Bin162]|nr:MAG: DNA polymerase I [Smithella sp. PtaU1.Bin162]
MTIKIRKEEDNEIKAASAQEIFDRFKARFHYITNRDQVNKAIESIYSKQPGTVLGLDIETAKLEGFEQNEKAGLDPHLSRIRLVQICTGYEIFIFDIDAIGLKLLEPIWYLPMVAHNAIFEIKHLLHAGINPLQIDCTMLMANAIKGGLPSLKELALDRLGLTISKALQTSDWNAPELSKDQLSYAALDALLAYWLYQNIMGDLKNNQSNIYNLMKGSLKSIAKLELNGFCFDIANHIILMADWEKRKEAEEKNLRKLLGSEINFDSPKQLACWLENNLDKPTLSKWPKSSKGQLKTDADTLAQFPDHPLVQPMLKYREVTKLLSTYGETFVSQINPVTDRMHSNFRIGGAATGRFTSGSPNIQNVPKDKAFRSLFIAPPEQFLVVGDYSQIELRVAALISKDPILLEAYERGEDLHKKTASVISGTPMNQITKEQRQAAKAVNFGLLYGQGAKGLARYAKANYGINMTEFEANNNRNAFFQTYSEFAKWQERQSSYTRQIMQTRTPSGRIRNFSTEQNGFRHTEALNTPIQGGAAEVLLAALSRLDDYLEGLDAKLVNIVHDEIVVEVSAEHLGQAITAVENAMIEGMLAIFPDASIKNLVDLQIGNNWAEAK